MLIDQVQEGVIAGLPSLVHSVLLSLSSDRVLQVGWGSVPLVPGGVILALALIIFWLVPHKRGLLILGYSSFAGIKLIIIPSLNRVATKRPIGIVPIRL